MGPARCSGKAWCVCRPCRRPYADRARTVRSPCAERAHARPCRVATFARVWLLLPLACTAHPTPNAAADGVVRAHHHHARPCAMRRNRFFLCVMAARRPSSRDRHFTPTTTPSSSRRTLSDCGPLGAARKRTYARRGVVRRGVLCRAVPRRAVPCAHTAAPRHAVLYNTMPCGAILCHAVPLHAVPCCAVPLHAVPCCAAPCRAVQAARHGRARGTRCACPAPPRSNTSQHTAATRLTTLPQRLVPPYRNT